MKSAAPGQNTSQVEVTNVSPHGFWLLIRDEELFVSFKEFPWFKEASIAQITRVELPSAHHLYWPALDIDLAVESIEYPERYPLVSQGHQAFAADEGAAASGIRIAPVPGAKPPP